MVLGRWFDSSCDTWAGGGRFAMRSNGIAPMDRRDVSRRVIAHRGRQLFGQRRRRRLERAIPGRHRARKHSVGADDHLPETAAVLAASAHDDGMPGL